jgi:hypothetical protein
MISSDFAKSAGINGPCCAVFVLGRPPWRSGWDTHDRVPSSPILLTIFPDGPPIAVLQFRVNDFQFHPQSPDLTNDNIFAEDLVSKSLSGPIAQLHTR